MSHSVSRIGDSLAPLRERLINHPVYEWMSDIRHVQIFMEHHVYAVWDFMSLFKSLQRKFGCFQIPWAPSPYPGAVRLLNEIALCEESDEDSQGGYKSHFELYREAMVSSGASTVRIDNLLAQINCNPNEQFTIAELDLPASVKVFVSSTFDIIARDNTVELASAFLYGREDILPTLFTQIIRTISGDFSGRLDGFVYYLDRHIEVDQDEHQPVAVRLLQSLCGNDVAKLERARNTAFNAIDNRNRLWDGILAEFERYSQDRNERLV